MSLGSALSQSSLEMLCPRDTSQQLSLKLFATMRPTMCPPRCLLSDPMRRYHRAVHGGGVPTPPPCRLLVCLSDRLHSTAAGTASASMQLGLEWKSSTGASLSDCARAGTASFSWCFVTGSTHFWSPESSGFDSIIGTLARTIAPARSTQRAVRLKPLARGVQLHFIRRSRGRLVSARACRVDGRDLVELGGSQEVARRHQSRRRVPDGEPRLRRRRHEYLIVGRSVVGRVN